jgi:translation initiation factor IF-3
VSRPYAPRNYSHAPQHRLNGKIRAREVRVIGPDNQQIGVVSLNDALRMAQNLGVDLVEIAATATPPVCRLVDYGKFRYEESKRQKKSSESAAHQLKEIQLRPGIAPHDYTTKLNHAREFLLDGAQLKLAMRFRGREMRHPEIGIQLVEKFIADLVDCGRADSPPRRVERNINVMLRPLARQQRAKPAAPKPEPPPPQNGPNVAPEPLS